MKVKHVITLCAAVLIFPWLLSGICRADIYKYVDKNGVVHFTNTPTHRNYRVVIKSSPPQQLKEQRYDGLIRDLCRKHRMDTALIKAVVKAESAFDPYAVSKKGAQGLMQLMPTKAQELRVDNPFKPRENLQGGIRYLRELLDKFKGDVRLALAAYNAGENIVADRGIPPYKETRTYIKRVLDYRNKYLSIR